jgi:hypothetical protein
MQVLKLAISTIEIQSTISEDITRFITSTPPISITETFVTGTGRDSRSRYMTSCVHEEMCSTFIWMMNEYQYEGWTHRVSACTLTHQTATSRTFPVNVVSDFNLYSIHPLQHCLHARKPRYIHSWSLSLSGLGYPSIRIKGNNWKTRHTMLLNQVVRVPHKWRVIWLLVHSQCS